MKKLLLLSLIAFSLVSTAQTTSIPDSNFEQRLIFLGYDNVIDGGVLTANISGVTSLSLSGQNISDLTGIEDFTALKTLFCNNNQLANLDVTQITALELLWCDNNQLTNLDVTQNTALDYLVCTNNNLVCLNVANGNNTNSTDFFATGNVSLTCIEVDDATWSTANWPDIDSQTSFSLDCNNDCSTSTVGINEITSSNISLYPNPTNNGITLDIEGYNGSVNVEVYDLQGRLLETTTNTTVSMHEYAKGIYVFKVAYGDRTQELKVVKE